MIAGGKTVAALLTSLTLAVGLGISAGKLVTPYLKLGGNLAYAYLTADPEAVVTTG